MRLRVSGADTADGVAEVFACEGWELYGLGEHCAFVGRVEGEG